MTDEIRPRVDGERVMVCDRQCPSAGESDVGAGGFMRVQCAIDGVVRFNREGECTEHHRRLAAKLKEMKQPWLLSYDDCPEVRALYSWAQIETVDVGYSICGQTRKRELLVSR